MNMMLLRERTHGQSILIQSSWYLGLTTRSTFYADTLYGREALTGIHIMPNVSLMTDTTLIP
ncbi:hypothetical protein GQR93_13870 [Lentilactobacillus hilgardii]|uniref:Uncharacterized protein n=1 Tax=Lentilactobacillus hilgardii TaxID=1588 RepID=A0A6P1E719_LENHI|nr:hypothetical protein HMPREF0496_0160 [Lentilactobacillus hilgardii ATCC 27305]MCT3391302.1 hypothetical protein [Lentilactobacillus hilgardii]QHB53196.1 hypothetical protein GQR93_13870 [Lentilactobacillus hilgardii]RRG11282.1 MAG: hypothetical protein DUD35_07300 [Lactobacillus sp.]